MRTSIACQGIALLFFAACAGDSNGNNDTGVTTVPTTAGSGSADGMNTSDGGGDGSSGGGDGSATGATSAATSAGTSVGTSATTGVADSTTGMPPAGPTCQHQCATPQDCNIDGMDSGLGCNMGLCSVTCTGDMECIAALSGWTLYPCSSESDCMGAGSCVDIGGGVGGCALTPSQGPCSDAMQVQTMATAIGGGTITVCGQPAAICSPFGGQNICIIGCAGKPCAGDLTCDMTDGLCKCDFDTQCVDTGLGNNCNGESLCEFACQQPTDCPAAPYDGGMVVCQ